MHPSKVVLVAAAVNLLALMLDKREYVVIIQQQLANSNVATTSRLAGIPDESAQVPVSCDVGCSSSEKGYDVLDFIRPGIVERRLYLV